MMRNYSDQMLIAIKLVTDDQVDPYKLAQFLELVTQFLRLVVAVMLVVQTAFYVLDGWAAGLNDAFDASIAWLRWQLLPLNVAPMG